MSEIITVTTQEDLNAIPADFEGCVEVAFGDEETPAIIDRESPSAVFKTKGETVVMVIGRYNSGDFNYGSANRGDHNAGNWNSGDWNSGDWNSGDDNSGDRNSGSYNRGNRNRGDRNSGFYNSGDCNSGNWNSGTYNSGVYNRGWHNSGSSNIGDRNSGSFNSGSFNAGDHNAGDYNTASYVVGYFNTESQKLKFFDQETDMTFEEWEKSKARRILERMPFNCVIWVPSDEMTEEEKEAYPEHTITGGFLKKCDSADACNKWWKELSESEREIIRSIPNFDAQKFYAITGIRV